MNPSEIIFKRKLHNKMNRYELSRTKQNNTIRKKMKGSKSKQNKINNEIIIEEQDCMCAGISKREDG